MRKDLIFTDFPADWDYYDGTHCVYRHHTMGIAAFQEAILKAHRRFYRSFRPGLQRLLKLCRQPTGLGDKLRLFWRHARLARSVLRQWQAETARFLERVRGKDAASLLPT